MNSEKTECPLVSIVVPIYNMGNIANKCLRELLKQDYRNLEYVFVDDGSTDNSYDVCKRISEEDSRVRVFSTGNRGSGPARNYGIAQAKGEFVYFPDADDFLRTDAISSLMKRVNDYPDADLFVFGFTNINEKGAILSVRNYPNAVFNADDLRNDYSKCMGTKTPLGIQGAPWNKFFKMSIIKDHKIEYPPLRRHQDEGFISRYMCFTTKVVFMSEVLYTYVVNDTRKTWSKYPIDYYNAAIGLNEVRKETILRWNPNDNATHEFIRREYICNIVKSLELMFSPKVNKAGISKMDYISNVLDKSKLLTKAKPSNLGPYQSIVLLLLKISRYLAIPVLYIKVLSNRLGLVR